MAPPNVKIKHITRSPSSSGDTRFPKLDECAHFHYENVELGPIKVLLCDKQSDPCKSVLCSASANKENESEHLCFLVTVISNGRKWVVRRSYQNFVFLDTQLHRCVYDRKYSLLRELPALARDGVREEDFEEKIRNLLSEYLERFSQLAGSLINCGPVLNWFELDNRGNRLIVTDEVAINTPAVAAAYVVVRYSAQATDEISFEVGDMISVIDMPPPEESSWWRGKRGFEVGFFPSECVEVIGDKVPNSFKLSNSSTKPVFRRHGKLIAFFRSFLLSRPSRRKLKQSGILKERVFGCDLGEHLLNTGREIPMVLKCCSEFIEEYGIVDGIYRLSGVSSNIQRLRLAFDEDRPLNLGDPATVHDIHSVASLLKMYFRELPNPLLTYQLYDKFVSAVQSSEEVRLLKVRDVVQQLPPPHFRTLQYLLSHLARVAAHGEETGMTPKNIAIVWAPNLLRSRDVENGGVGALHVVGVQAVLTEYLIRFSDLIFDEKVPFISEQEGLLRARPKSLAISTPTKLLSLEEARARALSTHLPTSQQKYIEVGGGPDKLPAKYHTVIDLPGGKQSSLPKLKKSPSGWKSFFSRGWYSGSTRDKGRFRSARKASTGSLPHHSAYMPDKPSTEEDATYGHRKKLRTVKSAESLAHCLKDSPQHSNKEEFSGPSTTSPKTSPQVSMDSSHSLEMPSPLQKHTRSSSHESYFENNDVMSDPSFEEDEHGLFYYVSEQMKKMQQRSSSQWSPTMESDAAENAASMKNMDNKNDFEMDAENSSRKQKLSPSEDFAQTKFQKLDENEYESLPTDPSALHCPSNEAFGLLPPNANDIWDRDDYGGDLTLDPFLLYEAVVSKQRSLQSSDDTGNDRTVVEQYRSGKRYSPLLSSSDGENDRTVRERYDQGKRYSPSLSSSDAENVDTNDRTVVERYGNAETVLVEVHATQDSSSEEEQGMSVLDSDSVFFSESGQESRLSETNNRSAEIDQRLSGTVNTLSETTDRLNASSVEVQDCRLDFSDEEFELSSPNETNTLFYDESKSKVLSSPTENTNIETVDLPSVVIPEYKNIELLNAEILDSKSVLSSETSEALSEASHSGSALPSEPLANLEECKIEQTKDLQATKKPIDLQLDLTPVETEEFDNTLPFSINSPPSPVYPPKSLKLHDFQSLKTKMDQLPPHKKAQIIIPSSPVDEVRKKFELQSKKPPEPDTKYRSHKQVESPTDDIKYRPHKPTESPTNDIKSRSHTKDMPKLARAFEDKTPVAKRHSEPPPNSPPSEVIKRISNKYEKVSCEKSKSKSSPQPSLFTQLKIRKLQSLQGDCGSPVPVDPWSDPILDLQEDYHPIYLQTTEDDSSTVKSCDETDTERVSPAEDRTESSDIAVEDSSRIKEEPAEEKSEGTTIALLQSQPSCTSKEADDPSPSKTSETPESEAVKRERINRIKEERRAQLREKLKQESFRMEAEEKEKVQTKFRLRREGSKHSLVFEDVEVNEHSELDVSSDSCKSRRPDPESRAMNTSTESNKSRLSEGCSEAEKVKFRLRKGSSSDVPSDDCGGNLNISSESNKAQAKLRPRKDGSKLPSTDDDCGKMVEDQKSDSNKLRTRLDSETQDPNVRKRVSSPGDFVMMQNKSNCSKKSVRSSYDEGRKWLSMPPTDIRDKVAMFERSKDASDLCRLGPSGKFPQKQSPSALASSFVR